VGDLVVTVPKTIWREWLEEGDCAGDPYTGEEWGFYLGGGRPRASRGDRLYIVAWGMLRGYAPVTRVVRTPRGWCICREGEAVACTIGAHIQGFRGWRERWWPLSAEKQFPGWRTVGTPWHKQGVLPGLEVAF